MRFRNTLVLLLILAGLGGYLYFVDAPRQRSAADAQQLVQASADQIDRITLARGDQALEIERREDEWHLVRPVRARADDTAVRTLVNAVADAKVQQELGPLEGDPARFGLAEPEVEITIDGPEIEAATVRLGKAAPVGNTAYVQRADGDAILLVLAAFRSQVDKGVDDLRDRSLVDLDDDQPAWIEIAKGERKVRFERDEASDGWRLVQPEEFAGDDAAIDTYLSSLRSLRAASFVAEESPDLEPYGLDSPRLHVAFGGSEGPLGELSIGGEKSATEFYAKLGGSPTVYTIHDWAYRNLDKSARDLRDKRLFAFALEDVRAIHVVRKKGEGFRLLREGEAWTVDGVDGKVAQREIEQFVQDVADLRGYEIVADEVADPAVFGFDEPELQLSVFAAGDESLGSVIVGMTDGADGLKHFNTRRTDASTVVLLRSYLFNRLDRDPQSFVVEADAAADDA